MANLLSTRSHEYDEPQRESDEEREGRFPVPGKRTSTQIFRGRIRRFANGSSIQPSAAEAVQRASTSSGQSLPTDLKRQLEQKMGADLSGLRIHTGAEAEAAATLLGANAFALGNNIFFGANKYDPSSVSGRELIAHEAAHTRQQEGASFSSTMEVSQPGDAHEVEADRFAQSFTAGDVAAPIQSVSRGVVSRQVIQRDEAAAAPAAEQASAEDMEAEYAALKEEQPELERIRGATMVRAARLTAAQTSGTRAIEAMRSKLLRAAQKYELAFKEHERVLKAAEQEAQNQQENTDIVVGIAIAVSVGLFIEVIGAAAAIDAAAGGAAGALGRHAIRRGADAGSEGVEVVAGAASQDARRVSGQELDSVGLTPSILRMEIWKQIAEAYSKLGGVAESVMNEMLISSGAEYVIGEIKSVRGGGADLSIEEIWDEVEGLHQADAQSQATESAITRLEAAITQLQSSASVDANYSTTDMEKDIWTLWMASLPLDCNIIDLDAIEDHLAGLGLVDFGSYTSDADENAAITEARARATEIRARRDAAFGGATAE